MREDCLLCKKNLSWFQIDWKLNTLTLSNVFSESCVFRSLKDKMNQVPFIQVGNVQERTGKRHANISREK
jgi:hypothetical protein